MKRVAILGSDATMIAQLKALLATRCEVVDIKESEGRTTRECSDMTITIESGRILVGDCEYSIEDFEAARQEELEMRERRRRFEVLLAIPPIWQEAEDRCCGEFGWPDDDNEYNVSQAQMMRRRDQHVATIRWQHVRPVKARKPRRNSTRGRR